MISKGAMDDGSQKAIFIVCPCSTAARENTPQLPIP